MSVRVALILICAAASVVAQTEAPSPSGAAAKVSLPPVGPVESASGPVIAPSGPAIEGDVPKSAPPETNANAPKPAAEPPARAPASAAQNKQPASQPGGKLKDSKTEPESSARRPYVFGVNDIIIVKIWNQPAMSGAFPIGTDGNVSVPLVGDIKAEGLNAKQVAAALTERLKECCVNNPEGEVDVQLGANHSKRYTVFGGVGRGGEYPLDRDDLTILDALASVGGFRDFANRKKIRLMRGSQTFDFNYEDAIKGKHLEKNIVIQNGDRIIVPE
jgi:polysaccharide biosynthesis/export protein